MALRQWLGHAAPVRQVTEITPANVGIDDVFTVIINSKEVSYTAVAATVADVCQGLTAALQASSIPEFAEIEWSTDDSVITALGPESGAPFVLTTDTTDGDASDTQTLTPSTTTDATGPNDFENEDNWSGNAVPVGGDDLVFDIGNSDLLYNLDQSGLASAVTLRIEMGYSGDIGLPKVNEGGNSPYIEYRDDYLAIPCSDVNLGAGEGGGSGRIKIDAGSQQCVMNVADTGQPPDQSVPTVQFKGTHASNEVNIVKGNVGIAVGAGEVATVDTLRVGFINNPIGDSVVRVGDDVTLDAVDMSGGQVSIESDTTIVNMTNGELRLRGESTHAEINIDGGTVFYQTTGTLTQGRVGSDGVLDLSRDMRLRTITNLELHENSSYLDPFKTATYTNPVQLVRTSIEQLRSVDFGTHISIAPDSL